MSLNNKNTPATASFFVKLVTEKEIQKDSVKKYYNTVKSYSPNGVLNSYDVEGPDGNPSTAYLVHRVNNENRHEYEIPLTRDLTSDEILRIVEQLNATFIEGDFLFETSSYDDNCCPFEEEDEYFDQDIYENLSINMAKRMHNKWLNERITNGWVYGEERSDTSKTHPLIKPWDMLSEYEKTIDYDLPKEFIDLLSEYGYTVISNEDLDDLLK